MRAWGGSFEADRAEDNAADDEAGGEEEKTLAFRVSVPAEPTGDVVSGVAGEIGAHVDKAGGGCGCSGGEAEGR